MVGLRSALSANKARAEMHLTGQITATLTNAGQFYKLENALMSDGSCQHWSYGSSTLTYTRTEATADEYFLFNGSADVAIDKACRVTFLLYKNNTAITTTQTAVDFTNTAKTKGFATNEIVAAKYNDFFDVRAASSTANSTLTIADFRVTFWGE